MQLQRFGLAGMTFVLTAVACSEAHEPLPPGAPSTDTSDRASNAGGPDAATTGTGAAAAGPGGSGAAASGADAAPGVSGWPADAASPSAGGGLSGSGPGVVAAGLTGGVGGATVGGVGNPFVPPPGCRDGGPRHVAWIADDRTFVISTAEQACGAPASAALRPQGDCAHPRRYVTYRVPTLLAPGTYQVGREASIVIERQFPIGASEAGCTCLPSIDTPQALTSGTITIALFSNGEIGADIEGEGVTESILIGRCPGR